MMKRFWRLIRPLDLNAQRPLQRDVQTVELTVSATEVPHWMALSLGQDIGTRNEQQDYCACCSVEQGFSAVVCDGMGGLADSRIAAQTAAQVWLSLVKTFSGNFAAFAENAAKQMDAAIRQRSEQGGTTIAAVLLEGNALHWISVGDSKIYIFRENTMVSATREHNYQMVLDQRLHRGEISLPTYKRESAKGAHLVSYLGKGQLPYLDISTTPFLLHRGDIVLLCSDGLYKSLHESTLQNILCQYQGDFETLGSYLMYLTQLHREVRDNTTVIAIRYLGENVIIGT